MKYILGLLLAFCVTSAEAQSTVKVCVPTGNGNSCQDVTSSVPLPVTPIAIYPAGAVAITGNSSGSTGAVVGTLSSASGKTAYICGFDVSAIGGTAAVGPITVAGLVGSSMVYQISSSVAGTTFSRTYSPCIPASATNTNITVTTTADGTASAVTVNSYGFRQ